MNDISDSRPVVMGSREYCLARLDATPTEMKTVISPMLMLKGNMSSAR